MKHSARVLALAFSLTLAPEILVRVAATFSFDVRYLATAGTSRTLGYQSLEDFLSSFSPMLTPHKVWNNYYSNSLGFFDREFSVLKPSGTIRIMGLGDSFAFGWMGYRQNVLPLVEQAMNRDCGGRKFEFMNFAIPGAGLAEYRLVHAFAAPRYKPDRVVVHFYMGADGPNLVTGEQGLPAVRPTWGSDSYAWIFLRNSVNALRSVKSGTVAASNYANDSNARGGERASKQSDLPDLPPIFTEEVFSRVMTMEMEHLYRGPDFRHLWNATLEALDSISNEVLASTGNTPIIILYPSQAQVYPEVFERTSRTLFEGMPKLNATEFDANFPATMVFSYCRRSRVPCHDITPVLIDAARAKPEPLYRLRDNHWNARGNRVAAEAEAAFLRTVLCTNRSTDDQTRLSGVR